MNAKTQEYEIGKRHLAKMMGIDLSQMDEKNNSRFYLKSVDVKYRILF